MDAFLWFNQGSPIDILSLVIIILEESLPPKAERIGTDYRAK